MRLLGDTAAQEPHTLQASSTSTHVAAQRQTPPLSRVWLSRRSTTLPSTWQAPAGGLLPYPACGWSSTRRLRVPRAGALGRHRATKEERVCRMRSAHAHRSMVHGGIPDQGEWLKHGQAVHCSLQVRPVCVHDCLRLFFAHHLCTCMRRNTSQLAVCTIRFAGVFWMLLQWAASPAAHCSAGWAGDGGCRSYMQ